MLKIHIREIREQKHLSQQKLSKLSGVSSSHIGYIENGEREPTISVLCKLAKALNVDIKDLYDYED